MPIIVASSADGAYLPFVYVQLGIEFSVLFFPVMPFVFSLSGSVREIQGPSTVSGHFTGSLRGQMGHLPYTFFIRTNVNADATFSFVTSGRSDLRVRARGALTRDGIFSPSLGT